MEFFRIRRDIPFMRHALVFNVISLITFLLAVFFLVKNGLHLSIEFKGGTAIEMAYCAGRPDVAQGARDARSREAGRRQVQNYGSASNVLIRLPARTDMKQEQVVAQVFQRLCTAEKGKAERREPASERASW
jgi:preprotein translocase subunit SecF